MATVGDDNQVGSFASFFAGIGSGLIDIPRGFFSLGASLVDLGLDSDLAGRVENAFDQIDPFDEAAEATAAGRFSKLLANVAVPGGLGFNLGRRLAKQAIGAKKNGLYFSPKAASQSDEIKKALTFNQKVLVGAGGALGSGAADAVFTAETNIDNFRPLFTDPLDLDYEGRDSAAQQLIRRVQFGTEGAVFAGLIGGSINGIKALRNRTTKLKGHNTKLDALISKLTPEGALGSEIFKIQREILGKRGSDLNFTGETTRDFDKNIDGLFPFLKRTFDKTTKDQRTKLLGKLNDVLKSGKPNVEALNSFVLKRPEKADQIFSTRKEAADYLEKVGGKLTTKGGNAKIKLFKTAKVDFGDINLKNPNEETKKAISELSKLGADDKKIRAIFSNINSIRGQWSNLFTVLGGKMSNKQVNTFKELFGEKFKDYLGSTYEIFENKSLFGMFGYKPAEEAVDKLANLYMKYDPKMTREAAEFEVARLVKGAQKGGAGIKLREGRTLGALVPVPALKELIDPENLKYIRDYNKVGVEFLETDARKAIEAVLGKINDPFVTMLQGTNRLSVITRRNEFLDNVVGRNLQNLKSDEAQKLFGRDKEQFLFRALDNTEEGKAAAIAAASAKFGHGNIRAINIDPGGKLDFGGRANPINGLYTDGKIADALEQVGGKVSEERWYLQAYNNFLLYPKATAQLAKTVLSPITHVRNILSAGAFATANGLIPGITVKPGEFAEAFKEAYKTLDVAGIGTRKKMERYRELLELGVVNTQVQVGDLQNLLRDTKFGETLTATTGIGPFFKMLGKAKKWSQDMYTAEDDIWKITTFALERARTLKALRKYGVELGQEMTDSAGNVIKITDEYLDQRAADIVKNNVPNYDYVNDFVKDLRRLPFGNFVSFPAEIMRTSANILSSGAREVNEVYKRADGKEIKPFAGIGYKRLFGFGSTVAVVPYATQEAFKAIHNVTEDEMQALRRYVPEWSKNSTLLPMRTEDGKMKYIDFSHANAYDLMIRPFNTILNAAVRGTQDDTRLKDEVVSGVFEAMKELGEPFISESIWTETVLDLTLRGGRTIDGRRLYTEQTPVGDRVTAIMKHLVDSQMPFSAKQMSRIGLVVNEKTDAYGNRFELGNEVAGFVGLRAIEVDPEKAIRFKIADFNLGINNSRREFSSPLLKGGSVTPEEIIDRYDVANRSMYYVQQDMYKDYYSALQLGANSRVLDRQFENRVSTKQLTAIKKGRFTPFKPSENIERKFRENAAAIGEKDPYAIAKSSVNERFNNYNRLPLLMEGLPIFENPFSNLGAFSGTETLPTANIPGLGTTEIITPGITPNNMQNTLAKVQTIDDFIKP